MDLSISTFWWVAAGVVVAAELATGTFYLLMIALGLAGAAVAAQLGMSSAWQIAVAALVGGGATALWHLYRVKNQPAAVAVSQNRDVNMDIGERVTVAAWLPDHTARVQYRGTQWTARPQPGVPETTGEHIVQAVEGNWLVIAPSPR